MMLFRPLYRPSVRAASIIMRLCIAVILAAGATWIFMPQWRDTPLLGGGLLALVLLAAVMGAWHDGHAIGEKKGRENGNALILILIAVVLFAGLTAAMNQGSRTSAGMVTDQQAQLYATEVIAYSDALKQAVQRMLSRGISENDLDFGNDIYTHINGDPITPYGHNPNCETDSCKVFHASGGGIVAQYFSKGALNSHPSPGPLSYMPGAGATRLVSLDGIGTQARDLIFQYSIMRRDVCIKINELLGVPNPNGEPPYFPLGSAANYNGSFPPPAAVGYSGGVVYGHPAYCCRSAIQPWNYLYTFSLIAR